MNSCHDVSDWNLENKVGSVFTVLDRYRWPQWSKIQWQSHCLTAWVLPLLCFAFSFTEEIMSFLQISEVTLCLEWLQLLFSTGRSISKWINLWQLSVILLTKAGGQDKSDNCDGFCIIRFKKFILKTRGVLESLWMTEMRIKCRYSFTHPTK